jgi:hypothetical protein
MHKLAEAPTSASPPFLIDLLSVDAAPEEGPLLAPSQSRFSLLSRPAAPKRPSTAALSDSLLSTRDASPIGMSPSLRRVGAAAALFAAAASAQSAPITSLPGLAAMPPYKMYSGYVPYQSPMLGSTHYTFHWVAESQGDATKDPIVFWVRAWRARARTLRVRALHFALGRMRAHAHIMARRSHSCLARMRSRAARARSPAPPLARGAHARACTSARACARAHGRFRCFVFPQTNGGPGCSGLYGMVSLRAAHHLVPPRRAPHATLPHNC